MCARTANLAKDGRRAHERIDRTNVLVAAAHDVMRADAKQATDALLGRDATLEGDGRAVQALRVLQPRVEDLHLVLLERRGQTRRHAAPLGALADELVVLHLRGNRAATCGAIEQRVRKFNTRH